MNRELSGRHHEIIPGFAAPSRADGGALGYARLRSNPPAAPIRRTPRSLAQVGGTCYHTLAHASGGRAAWDYLALPSKFNGLIENHRVVGGALSWHLRRQGWAA